MTRINLVHVEDLADQHLFAEWREIKMVPAKVRKLWEDKTLGEVVDILSRAPETYTMSTGHVSFFYNRAQFLHDRYEELTAELLKRQYNITQSKTAQELFLDKIPLWAFSPLRWIPSIPEIKINVDRISERLHQRPEWYRHYGKVQPPEFFIERYNHQMTVDVLS